MGTNVKCEEIWLRNRSLQGEPLSVCFIPEKGMNFVSYIKGEIQALDLTTHAIFEDRSSGLGALIGPHFHHRKSIPEIKNPNLFPHIARLKERGIQEPFSHGIGRYAPWKVLAANEHELKAKLSGKDRWNGVALKDLEGQDFEMFYTARLLPQGLEIELSVKSERPSVVGLHTYYALCRGEGVITTQVEPQMNDHGTLKTIEGSSWNYSNRVLHFDLEHEIDHGFFPDPDPTHGLVFLKTHTHALHVEYWSPNADNSLQLWHPKGVSFVCIEPLSAKDPRNPQLSESSLKILISLL